MRLRTIAILSTCALVANAYLYQDEQDDLDSLFERSFAPDDTLDQPRILDRRRVPSRAEENARLAAAANAAEVTRLARIRDEAIMRAAERDRVYDLRISEETTELKAARSRVASLLERNTRAINDWLEGRTHWAFGSVFDDLVDERLGILGNPHLYSPPNYTMAPVKHANELLFGIYQNNVTKELGVDFTGHQSYGNWPPGQVATFRVDVVASRMFLGLRIKVFRGQGALNELSGWFPCD